MTAPAPPAANPAHSTGANAAPARPEREQPDPNRFVVEWALNPNEERYPPSGHRRA